MSGKHPVDQLSIEEIQMAKNGVLGLGDQPLVYFRSIYVVEPLKDELVKFLELEHAQTLTKDSHRPSRIARVEYDVVQPDGSCTYRASHVDILSGDVKTSFELGSHSEPFLDEDEILTVSSLCHESPLFQQACRGLNLGPEYKVTIDAWPFHLNSASGTRHRNVRGMCYATLRENPESNRYAFPLPIAPIVDVYTKSVQVQRLATGGRQDELVFRTGPENAIGHCHTAEYIPRLIEYSVPTGLRELDNPASEDSSLTNGESLVSWQKWRFRVTHTPKEGAVLHDVHYDGRSVLYRLSLSGVLNLHGDPRDPAYLRQDSQLRLSSNNLPLAADVLKVIKYIDAVLIDGKGDPVLLKRAVRIYEAHDGIAWMHTDPKTSRSVIMESRSVIVEFIFVLGSQDYLVAFKLDQSGRIRTEIRLTGILPVINIDPGKVSDYGRVVSPGTLARHSQHYFAMRIDPAVDGYSNKVVVEDTLPVTIGDNAIITVPQIVTQPTSLPQSRTRPRTLNPFALHETKIRMENTSNINSISGNPVAYRFRVPRQLLAKRDNSRVNKFCDWITKPVWITRYKEGDIYAAGDTINVEEGYGVIDGVNDNSSIEKSGAVIWAVLGITHIASPEDWPVTAVEKLELCLSPADFFTRNPTLAAAGPASTSSFGDNHVAQEQARTISDTNKHKSALLDKNQGSERSPLENSRSNVPESASEANKDSKTVEDHVADKPVTIDKDSSSDATSPETLSLVQGTPDIHDDPGDEIYQRGIENSGTLPSSSDAKPSGTSEIGAGSAMASKKFKDTLEDWTEASKYEEVIHLSCRFLKGKQQKAPCHLEPIDEETLPLVPMLLRMHEYGFLTVNGQPSTQGEDKNGHWESRGYVDFVVPTSEKVKKSKVQEFCEELLKSDQLIVTIKTDDGEILKTNQTVEVLPLHRHRHKTSDAWEESSSTSLQLDSEDHTIVFFKELGCQPVLASQPLVIGATTQGFNVSFSLEQLIIDYAERCGISPAYQCNTVV